MSPVPGRWWPNSWARSLRSSWPANAPNIIRTAGTMSLGRVATTGNDIAQSEARLVAAARVCTRRSRAKQLISLHWPILISFRANIQIRPIVFCRALEWPAAKSPRGSSSSSNDDDDDADRGPANSSRADQHFLAPAQFPPREQVQVWRAPSSGPPAISFMARVNGAAFNTAPRIDSDATWPVFQRLGRFARPPPRRSLRPSS